jgi:hypothetical protein
MDKRLSIVNGSHSLLDKLPIKPAAFQPSHLSTRNGGSGFVENLAAQRPNLLIAENPCPIMLYDTTKNATKVFESSGVKQSPPRSVKRKDKKN